MPNEKKLWRFIADRLRSDERLVLLIVADSSGSSPGRAGYKMAVAEDGELTGSIGGGVMEVKLVERAQRFLSEPPAVAGGLATAVVQQEHRRNAENASGMICSGEQTVIFKLLSPSDLDIVDAASKGSRERLTITPDRFAMTPGAHSQAISFDRTSETKFEYSERIGPNNRLVVIGGGHCALALSELMSKMDFHISIFDDRPELNTIEKNEFADEIRIIGSYDSIGEHLRSGDDTYVVVMTLGYKTDAVIIRALIDRDFKYFGVLGSRAKMATLMRELKADGHDADCLARIRTPIGIPINSRTPEEIAVSIAAEIISVKNSGPA